MSQFDERERAFEKKFQIDEEYKFKSSVRAAKLFGLWAADQLGLSGDEAEAYATQLSDIAVIKPGYDHLIKKVGQDLQAQGTTVSPHRLEKAMSDCDSASHKQAAAQG